MPLEVKELIIRAHISHGAPASPTAPPTLTAAQRKQMVNDCVQQVLKQLKKAQER